MARLALFITAASTWPTSTEVASPSDKRWRRSRHFFQNYTIESAPCDVCSPEAHPREYVHTPRGCDSLCALVTSCSGWVWNSFSRCYLKGGPLSFRRIFPDDHVSIAGRRRPTTVAAPLGSIHSTVVPREVVLDIGVNNGQDSVRYLSQGYGVIGVEPNPTALAAATQRGANRKGQRDRNGAHASAT